MKNKICAFGTNWIIEENLCEVNGKSVLVSTIKDDIPLRTFQIKGIETFKNKCYNVLTSHLTPETLQQAKSLFDTLWELKVEVHTMAVKPCPRQEFCGFSVSQIADEFSVICSEFEHHYIIHIDIKYGSSPDEILINIRLLKVRTT